MVTNDSIDLIITYQADLHKLSTTKKIINGTTKVKVYLNYTKVYFVSCLEINSRKRGDLDQWI